MDEWFDFTDLELENTNEYIEKIQLEETDDTEVTVGVQSRQKRENSWIRKNKYRKKLKKKFLSEKPGMTQEECYPLERTVHTVYLNQRAAMDGGCYCLNHVNHLYMTKRGHVEQFTGRVEWWLGGVLFGVGEKEHDIGKITNRRIRHEKISEEECEVMRYSDYKKKYAPKVIDVI